MLVLQTASMVISTLAMKTRCVHEVEGTSEAPAGTIRQLQALPANIE